MSSLLAEYYRRLTDSSSSEKPLRGYKVTDVNRTRKIGVACRSLQELKQKACAKLNVTCDLSEIGIFLLDGSEIDEEYFATVKPQTTLILRRPGEKLLTEADILYQMLRKVNENFLQSGERAAAFLTDKLKQKVALLNKALNNDDNKTMCSKREDHPEWFEGLDTNAATKEAYLHRRCQDRIRGYLYKTIEQIRSSEAYNDDTKARKQLQRIIVFFKLQLRKDHYFGHYFDRSRAIESTDSASQKALTRRTMRPIPLIPLRTAATIIVPVNSARQHTRGLKDDDEVDAKKLIRPKMTKDQDGKLVEDRDLEKEEMKLAEEKCSFDIVVRDEEDMKALCDQRGEFQCRGLWNLDTCSYGNRHKINPYRSKDELILFSTWNLDHKIERSRTLVPQILEVSKKDELNQQDIIEFYNNLFTTKNLRLVHIICHDKGSHK